MPYFCPTALRRRRLRPAKGAAATTPSPVSAEVASVGAWISLLLVTAILGLPGPVVAQGWDQDRLPFLLRIDPQEPVEERQRLEACIPRLDDPLSYVDLTLAQEALSDTQKGLDRLRISRATGNGLQLKGVFHPGAGSGKLEERLALCRSCGDHAEQLLPYLFSELLAKTLFDPAAGLVLPLRIIGCPKKGNSPLVLELEVPAGGWFDPALTFVVFEEKAGAYEDPGKVPEYLVYRDHHYENDRLLVTFSVPGSSSIQNLNCFCRGDAGCRDKRLVLGMRLTEPLVTTSRQNPSPDNLFGQ